MKKRNPTKSELEKLFKEENVTIVDVEMDEETWAYMNEEESEKFLTKLINREDNDEDFDY